MLGEMKVTYEEFQYWASRFLLWGIVFITVHLIVNNEVIAFLISFAYGAVTYKQGFKPGD